MSTHPSRRVIRGILLGISAALIFSWTAHILLSNPRVDFGWKLGVLILSAFICLAVGSIALIVVFRWRKNSSTAGSRMLTAASLAFLFPAFLLLIVNLSVPLFNAVTKNNSDLTVPYQPAAAPGQPFLFLWQALVLTIFCLPKRTPEIPAARPRRKEILPALFWGAGLGISAAMIYDIQQVFPVPLLTAATPAAIPVWLLLLLGIVSISIAPWAEERFFRGWLTPFLQAQTGILPGILLSSLLFAIFQFRAGAFLPAFLVGCGLEILRRIYPNPQTCAVAHAATNLILFCLGWWWVL